jgi:hypothetical protein
MSDSRKIVAAASVVVRRRAAGTRRGCRLPRRPGHPPWQPFLRAAARHRSATNVVRSAHDVPQWIKTPTSIATAQGRTTSTARSTRPHRTTSQSRTTYALNRDLPLQVYFLQPFVPPLGEYSGHQTAGAGRARFEFEPFVRGKFSTSPRTNKPGPSNRKFAARGTSRAAVGNTCAGKHALCGVEHVLRPTRDASGRNHPVARLRRTAFRAPGTHAFTSEGDVPGSSR